MKPSLLLLALLPLGLSACGEEEELPLFKPEEARAVVETLRERWAAGAVPPLMEICEAPFILNGRTWTSAQELQANLKEQLPRLKARVAKGEEIRVFGIRDLQKGTWPRGMSVPEDKREERIREMGIEADGFLVRVFTPPQRGWIAIVNPKGASKLMVRGLAF